MAVAPLEWDTAAYSAVLDAAIVASDPSIGISVVAKTTPWYPFKERSAGCRSLIVRKWHYAFWERYSKTLFYGRHQVAIIGTPGIGKTVAQNVFLWWLLRDADARDKRNAAPPAPASSQSAPAPLPSAGSAGATEATRSVSVPPRYVVLLLPKAPRVYIFDTEKRAMATTRVMDTTFFAVMDFVDPDWEANSIVLHDLGAGAGNASHTWCGEFVPAIYTTSPGEKKYQDTLKSSSASTDVFFAPLLDDAEMEFAAARVFSRSDDEWKQRAWVCGNVPRLVFEYTDDRFHYWLLRAKWKITS